MLAVKGKSDRALSTNVCTPTSGGWRDQAIAIALDVARRRSRDGRRAYADGGELSGASRIPGILESLGRGVRSGAGLDDALGRAFGVNTRERRDAARLADPNPWSHFAGEFLGSPVAGVRLMLTPLEMALEIVRRRANPEGSATGRRAGGRVDMRGGGRVAAACSGNGRRGGVSTARMREANRAPAISATRARITSKRIASRRPTKPRRPSLSDPRRGD